MSSLAKVVILCGGRGTRLNEETEFRPKPLVTVGNIPILVHIMETYSHYGYKDFVLCLGYKGELVKEFFLHKELLGNDFSFNLKSGAKKTHGSNEDWNITFVDTGLETQTGARIKRVEKYIDSDMFLATYGDGLCDVNISELVKFHKKQNTVGTITAVHPHSKYGLIKEGKNSLIESFVEKPVLYEYINGGFFAFKKNVFDYLSPDEQCILEAAPLTKLVSEKQLSMYRHEGFWHCMDTYKDYLDLNRIWDTGAIPWKKW